ncbi:SDR family oxidoreductase [Aquibacillus rhizosphaerae]|uniref:SDR family oxidoreductase n=1 Tax=Aquibacillus rhizosphaerae TaxID=3051431 RepID=A0ABT7LAV3_9BACI|nr:SDR family oxidoreductase [Aquibacillus sp. LR5S19]MDL4843001.1 SDR family oxidoreductase [Aquibacillus sp. LR5S19]
MKVLVAGANGHTGRLIVKNLIERGHDAYAMIRKAEQAPDLEKIGATTVLADLEKDVTSAVKGMDAAVFAAGSGSKTGPEKTKDVDRDGAINLMDSAKVNNVNRFVILSSFYADKPDIASGGMGHYLQMKGEADQHLQDSGLNFTVVRPGGLTHDKATGKVTVAEDIESGSISRADVADVIVTSLDEKNTFGKSFDLVNGEVAIEQALKTI